MDITGNCNKGGKKGKMEVIAVKLVMEPGDHNIIWTQFGIYS